MTRKLLPYEYELIDVLGISKEEYLDFVAQQHIYKDIKEGSALDVRNEPGTAALVLSIIGAIFQVAAILLIPKPREQEGSKQTRDQRLAPRIGFNGAQQLAVYGETVPLVYTSMDSHTNNSNPGGGGVRVSTLLLWSAILSFGNSQFMQLMTAISASRLGSIDFERTAIGQLPAKDIVPSNVWQYFNVDGPTTYNNYADSGPAPEDDPTYAGRAKQTAHLDGREGFSQCFSPTTANAVGVTGFIPINAKVLILNTEGDREFSSSNIQYTPRPDIFNEGAIIDVQINDNRTILLTTDALGIARQDAKRAAASMFDNGAIFKTGSALFRVKSLAYSDNGTTIDEGVLKVKLECIRGGKKFTFPYDIGHYLEGQDPHTNNINNNEIPAIQNRINALVTQINEIYVDLKFGLKSSRNGLVLLTDEDRNYLKGEIDKREAEKAERQSQLDALTTQVSNNVVAPFHTKGFARIEIATYASVTKCNEMDLVIKYDVFRRISGRNNVYGKEQRNYSHSSSDNGPKARTAMFRLEYRFDNTGDYAKVPYIFCARGTNEQSVFTFIKLVSVGEKRFIQVRLEPVVDPPTEDGVVGYCYLTSGGVESQSELTTAATRDPKLRVIFNGSQKVPGSNGYPPVNRSPKDTSEIDLFNYDAYTNSTFAFDNGPEIKITAVNEQTIESWNTYSYTLYKGLSTFALHLHSGPGTQDVRDITVWVKEGKFLRNIVPADPTTYRTADQKRALAASTPIRSSSLASDIFLDTILDKDNGIGKFASLHSVDVEQLAYSKRFCQRNKFFMDGLIGDARSWREFWAQTAPFSLLELAKIGGMDTLVPAVPYDKSTGDITRAVAISALFNQGNILEGTYKEEFIDYGSSTQDVIVTVIYRDVERNGIFPRNNSVEVKLTSTNEGNAIRETIDTSQFVTTERQATILGKFLCQTRRHTRKAVEFQTFPTDSFVMPGAFVYVETSNNQWDGIYTGRIEAEGVLNVPITGTVPNGIYNVLTYGNSTDGSGAYSDGTQSFTGITVTGNQATALASKAGQLFVLGTAVRSKRVFRVIEVSMEEEGETTIRAVEHPCDTNGNSLIAEGLTVTNSGLFTVDGSPG